MSKLPVAQALIARGLSVFPIRPGAKSPPLLQDWPRRAAHTAAEAEMLWAAVPDANVGIHAEGLVVVDVDTRSDGDASLQTLADIYPIPKTLTTITPTGGRHLFFRLPEGHPGVSNSAGRLGPGLDIRTTGGYVVAPGSDVEAGRYHFEADVPIAPAPQWLLDLLGTSGSRQRDNTPAADIPPAPPTLIEQAASWLAQQPVGGGSSYANACGLRDRGLSLEQARDVFAGHDPRPDALTQVDHAYRYAQGQPGAKAVLPSDFSVVSPSATPASAPVAKSTVLRLDQLAAQERKGEYLVKGLLQKASYAEVYGAPGEGKTFVALDLAYHVAAGKPWAGKNVHGGPVLYLAYEGMGGMVKRAQALRQRYGDAEVPFYVVGATFNLRELQGRADLGTTIAALPAKPVLIVIDTFAHALRGGDENSAQDVGAFNTAVVELIKATGACVLIVHHTGKNKAAGARGSSALNAAVDTEIRIEDKQITATKQRDLELGTPIGFKLTPVNVGLDEDGDVVQSCVVEEDVVPEKGAPIRGTAQLVFDALCRLSPNNEPVMVERWKNACTEFLGRQASKAFYRHRSTLVDRGYVVVDNEGMATRRLE